MSDVSGVTTTNLAANLLDARGQQVIGQLREGQPGESEAKIEKSARDFESILVSQWLDKAQQSFATMPGADEDEYDDPGHSQFQSLATQSLGSAIASAGGIGIAKMIVPALRAAEARRTGAQGAGDGASKHESSQIGTGARSR